jgi:uncharacterized protein (TIGR03067 family)
VRGRILLILVTAALLGFAPAPLPRQDRHRIDLTDVEGTWEFDLWENDGVREQQLEETLRAALTKKQFRLSSKANGERAEDFVMRLHPEAAPPAFTWSMGGQVRFVGSYRLHKDRLTMIFGRGDRVEGRPVDFAGKVPYRFVLRRVKR